MQSHKILLKKIMMLHNYPPCIFLKASRNRISWISWWIFHGFSFYSLFWYFISILGNSSLIYCEWWVRFLIHVWFLGFGFYSFYFWVLSEFFFFHLFYLYWLFFLGHFCFWIWIYNLNSFFNCILIFEKV